MSEKTKFLMAYHVLKAADGALDEFLVEHAAGSAAGVGPEHQRSLELAQAAERAEIAFREGAEAYAAWLSEQVDRGPW